MNFSRSTSEDQIAKNPKQAFQELFQEFNPTEQSEDYMEARFSEVMSGKLGFHLVFVGWFFGAQGFQKLIQNVMEFSAYHRVPCKITWRHRVSGPLGKCELWLIDIKNCDNLIYCD